MHEVGLAASRRRRVSLVLWGLVLLAVSGSSSAATGGEPLPSTPRERLLDALRASGRVGDALLAAYRESDVAPVVITLEAPARGRVSRSERRQRILELGGRVLADCPVSDFHLRHRFEHAAGLAGELHLRAVSRLLANPAVRAVDLDGGGHGALAETMALVGGYTASTAGFSGTGVTAAVLDSGVDNDHPDLAGMLVAQHCECSPGCCPGGADGPGSAEDDNGHGTLVAAVLASRGGLASIGLAPAADVVAVKVLDSNLVFSNASTIVAGLSWVVDNYTALPPAASTVRVVNMSLATDTRYTGSCDNAGGAISMLGDVVDELVTRGVTVVAAAGNAGDTAQLPAPACLSNVIAVGAVWDADVGSQSLDFGTFSCSDATTAPDQVTCYTNAAPNTDVFSPGGKMIGPINSGGIGLANGTSFSSPAVAGCAALLVEQDPMRTPAQIGSLITASPAQVTDPATMLSFPRLDCADALGLGPDDADSDFDGITVGAGDNCPLLSNTGQSDVEADGVGDRCDVCPLAEDGPDAGAGNQLDSDGDGTGDACECTGRDFWAGDVDGSGVVDDQSDIFVLEFNFGDTGVTPSDGDQNCDDVVDGADYTLWADHLGRASSEIDLSP
jgi:hypothetical protein